MYIGGISWVWPHNIIALQAPAPYSNAPRYSRSATAADVAATLNSLSAPKKCCVIRLNKADEAVAHYDSSVFEEVGIKVVDISYNKTQSQLCTAMRVRDVLVHLLAVFLLRSLDLLAEKHWHICVWCDSELFMGHNNIF